MGEYSAVADTLEIADDAIRFQGKAGALLRGGCPGPPRPGRRLRAGDKLRVTAFRGRGNTLSLRTHSLQTGHPLSHGSWVPAPGKGHLYLRGVLALTKASVFQPPSHQE